MGLIAKPNRFPIQRRRHKSLSQLFHSEPPNKSFYAKLLKFISFILPDGEYPGPENNLSNFKCKLLVQHPDSWGPSVNPHWRGWELPMGWISVAFFFFLNRKETVILRLIGRIATNLIWNWDPWFTIHVDLLPLFFLCLLFYPPNRHNRLEWSALLIY